MTDIHSIESLVPGFGYFPSSLTEGDENNLVQRINENQKRWEPDYSRLIQRYGYRYHHREKVLTRLEPLPDWLNSWAMRFFELGWTTCIADQVTVQSYEPGIGISEHFDDRKCFGSSIVTISLLSPCVYSLFHPKLRSRHELLVEPRSVVLLRESVRNEWKHGIPARKTDSIGTGQISRGPRLSLTFRTVNLDRVVSSINGDEIVEYSSIPQGA